MPRADELSDSLHDLSESYVVRTLNLYSYPGFDPSKGRFLEDQVLDINGVAAGFGIFGTLFGSVSGYYTIKGYRENKSVEGAHRLLLEEAQREWKARYTQAEVERLTAQFQQLPDQITREIPEQAKRTLWDQQKQSIADNIGELWEQYSTLSNQLAQVPTIDTLAPAIKGAIERDILPIYRIRQRQQRLAYVVILILLLLTVFPFTVDFLIDQFVGSVEASGFPVSPRDLLSYVGGCVIALFVAFSISAGRWQWILLRHRRASWLGCGLLLVSWFVLLMEVLFEPVLVNSDAQSLIAILSVFPLALGLRIGQMLYSWRPPRGKGSP